MNTEKKSLIRSFLLPLSFVGILWLVKLAEITIPVDLSSWGVFPRTAGGLVGILTSPLVHGDLKHLASNSIPLVVLGAMLFYFYRTLPMRVFIWVYVLSGFWLWLGGRESYHIGASGVVYGLTAFLFISGLLRRQNALMALSLVVIFLYGGLIWGIFPLYRMVSWEAHLFGMLAGLIMAITYRKKGPQRKKYDYELEEEEDESDVPEGYYNAGYYEDQGENYRGNDDEDDPLFRYIYKKRDKDSRDN